MWTETDYKDFIKRKEKKEQIPSRIKKLAKKVLKEVSKNTPLINTPEINLLPKKYYQILPITPQPAPRLVSSDKWKKRPVAIRYFQYKKEIQKLLTKLPCETELFLLFLMPIPKSWSIEKRKVMLYKKHQNRPDTDNMIKALKDALLSEDAHIYLECNAKIWANQGAIILFNNFDEWIDAINLYKNS